MTEVYIAMAEYFQDESGTIHVKARKGDEYTLCGLAYDADPESGFTDKPMVTVFGPANCRACRNAVHDLRDALKNCRFANILVER